MIKIKYHKKDIEKKHIADLNKRTAELLAIGVPTDRKEYMTRHSDWRKLSESLSKLSAYKCWYTEVYEIGAYFNVDHLRPKNEVKLKKGLALQNHILPASLKDEGYWWECYNWKNYRLSAAKPNSGYKNSYFAIAGTSSFWTNRMLANTEVPLLLDPLKQSDCDLLMFEMDGKIKADPTKAPSGSLNEAKVNATINIYGLNDSAFVNARKAEWAFTDKIACLADEIHVKLSSTLPSDVKVLLKKVKNVFIDILKVRVAQSAQFSRLNYFCLVATGKKWIRTEVLGIK